MQPEACGLWETFTVQWLGGCFNQEVSVHVESCFSFERGLFIGGVIGNMCLLDWDGESSNIVERGQPCFSAPAILCGS